MADQHGDQDRLLPIANVGRIMKQILPPSAKISKEAKLTMQECVSEFISFVTEEASDKCHKENRRTLNGDDVCWALSSLGFDDYGEAMEKYMHRYREYERQRGKETKRNNGEASNTRENDQSSGDHDNTTLAPLEFRILERGEGSLPRSNIFKP
ncbi:nuclear transcription factor Y subunit B-4-like [Impatiens glandulifera]|uniref:nuclear transcription factor Y subunit B-4-like n=1 Tax=Impatiens glandulifera TaxID=253017 RepID=UPI001FB0589D|nr:nuclear transcription factor Y subunit B-4-like [Impatiens glandulifera]